MKVLVICCNNPEYLDYTLPPLIRAVGTEDVFLLNNAGTQENGAAIRSQARAFQVNLLNPRSQRPAPCHYNLAWGMLTLADIFPTDLICKVDEDVFWPNPGCNFDEDLAENQVYMPAVNLNNYTSHYFFDSFKNSSDVPDVIRETLDGWDKFQNGMPFHHNDKREKLAEFIYSRPYSEYKDVTAYGKRDTSVVTYESSEHPLMSTRGISTMASVMHSAAILKTLDGVTYKCEEELMAGAVKSGDLEYLINWQDLACHIGYYTLNAWVDANWESVIRPWLEDAVGVEGLEC